MITKHILEALHLVKGIDPVADAFAGTVTTDIVNMRDYAVAAFLVYKGAGATGTSTITVEACADNSGTGATAVPFHYRRACNTNDAHGAVTAATAAGFATTAGASEMYFVVVSADDLVSTGYAWVRLKAVEVVDSPVTGGIAILLDQPSRPLNHSATAI